MRKRCVFMGDVRHVAMKEEKEEKEMRKAGDPKGRPLVGMIGLFTLVTNK